MQQKGNMELPLISIIVPVYNSEKYLDRCIHSLMNQTYSRIQILLIDDGSSDSSSTICDEYAKKDSRVVAFHQKNQGASSARNTGLEYFDGEYCTFVDADDFVALQYVEKLYDAIVRTHCKVAACRSFDMGAVPEKRDLSTKEAEPEIIWTKEYDFLAYYSHRTVWGALYHQSAVNNIRFVNDLAVGEDTLFFAEVLHGCEKSAFLNERLYYYIYYPNSLCHRAYDEKMFTEIIAWNRVCRLFSDFPNKVRRSAQAALAFHCRQSIKQLAAEKETGSIYFSRLVKIARRHCMSYFLSGQKKKAKLQYLFLCCFPFWYARIYRRYRSSDKIVSGSMKEKNHAEGSIEDKRRLISIIVPVYNVELFLEQCLQSIVSQTYGNFELILVDDASTDTSGKMCDEWAKTDSRIRVIHKKQNAGLSSARNTGVKSAKGDYVCFIDSDDYVSDRFLEILYENAVTFEADVSYCHFVRFYEDRQSEAKSHASEINLVQTKQKRDLWDLLTNINNYKSTELVVAWNKLIRSNVAKELEFLPGKWHEDEFYVNHLLEKAACFVETKAELYFYRQRSGSIMGKEQKMDSRHMDIIDAFEERVKISRKMMGQRSYNKMVSSYRGTILMQYAVLGTGKTAALLRRRLFRSLYQYPNKDTAKNAAKYILFFLHLWEPKTDVVQNQKIKKTMKKSIGGGTHGTVENGH